MGSRSPQGKKEGEEGDKESQVGGGDVVRTNTHSSGRRATEGLRTGNSSQKWQSHATCKDQEGFRLGKGRRYTSLPKRNEKS